MWQLTWQHSEIKTNRRLLAGRSSSECGRVMRLGCMVHHAAALQVLVSLLDWLLLLLPLFPQQLTALPTQKQIPR